MKKKNLFDIFFLIFVVGLKETTKRTSKISSFWKLVDPFPWKPSKIAGKGQISNPKGFFFYQVYINYFFCIYFFGHLPIKLCFEKDNFLVCFFLWIFKNINTQNGVIFWCNCNLFRYYNEFLKSQNVTLWRNI